MARLYDELSVVFCEIFSKDEYDFEYVKAFCEATIVCLRFKVYNNINGSAIEEGAKTLSMLDMVHSYGGYIKA
ncbi:MAG: hypothetical protein ACI4E1_05555 [Lachnospira sp.]